MLYHDTCHHKLYGLTCEAFDALRGRSAGCCELCGLPERENKSGRLNIDHKGDYHQVRGLLCDRCNSGTMRLVDSGRAGHLVGPEAEAVLRYLANPWIAADSPIPAPVPQGARASSDGTTRLRNIRVDLMLWREAMRIATERRETLSAVLKRALVEYVERHGGNVGR